MNLPRRLIVVPPLLVVWAACHRWRAAAGLPDRRAAWGSALEPALEPAIVPIGGNGPTGDGDAADPALVERVRTDRDASIGR